MGFLVRQGSVRVCLLGVYFSFVFFPWEPVCAVPAGIDGKIIVGVYENHPKIYTTSDGQARGFFPEIIDGIAQEEGWQIEYRKGTWQECLDRLERGEIDMMPDVAWSAERAEKYDFNNETVLISWAVIYTRPDITVQSFFDLTGRRIALIKGGIYSSGASGIRQILAQFDIDAQFVEYESYRDVFNAISEGQADAGVVNNIFGSFFENEFKVKRSPVLFSPSQLRFAFTKNDPLGKRLKPILDAQLRKLKGNPISAYYRAMDSHLYGTSHSTAPGVATNWVAALSDSEKAWLRRHPVIRAAVNPEFYPFEYWDDKGRFEGISSDYVKLFNERLGLNLQVMDGIAWTSAVAGMQSGAMDVLPCVGVSAERSRYMLFSKPYISFQRVIITRTEMPFLSGLSDIEKMHVGVQEESSHEGFIREQSLIEPVLFPSLQGCLLALSGGKIDAVVANLSSAAYWIRKLNLINLKVAAPASPDLETLHFAVRKDWPELVSILDKALDLVSPDQQREIEQRWVAVEYHPGIEPRIAWRIGLRIAAVVLVILVTILVWTYRLKKEIKSRRMAEQSLQYRERFERLVSETSSRFMALKPSDIDRHIEVTLTEMACFTKASAGYLYVFDQDGVPVRTHAGGDVAALDALGFGSGSGPRDADWLARLLDNRGVAISSNRLYSASGPPVPSAVERIVVEVPYGSEERVTGFIGLLNVCRSHSQWREEDVSLLRLVGQIFSSALRRKTTEEAMARYAADLEEANRKLQDLDRLKNMFIASVSHELRTPLNSIIGFTGVILKGLSGELTGKQRDQLTRVYSSGQHLLALITDIIDISKIEAGRIDVFPQVFMLDEMVNEALESIRPQLQAKSLRLESEVPANLEVCTDRKRLGQCLLNYLSNAVKYTEQGMVRVVVRDLGDEFEIAVVDTGIGITPEDQQRLFEAFVRLDSHLRIKAGGTGLGLYLTRKIVMDILLGTLSVSSEKGRGSTFAFRAPKRLPQGAPKEMEDRHEASAGC